MIERGGDFFVNKDGNVAVLTRRPCTKRWYRAVTFRNLREWLYECGQPAELIWTHFRAPFYEGDGQKVYELCMAYCFAPFNDPAEQGVGEEGVNESANQVS